MVEVENKLETFVNGDQIALDARERNFAFFDKFGIKCD